MSKKGENIYLRKDGRWEGRYIKGRKPDGRPCFVSIYGHCYADVKKRLILIKSRMYREELEWTLCRHESLGGWTEQWLETNVRPYVKPGTYAGYRRNIDNHIYPALGDLPLSRITTDKIQQAVNQWAGEMAPATVGGIYRLLKSIFTAACAQGLILRNPCHNIRLPKMVCRSPRVLTRKEQEKLEEKALETGELEYMLCLYTGLRVGELCALTWSDMDMENDVLHVRHAIQRIPAKDGTRKTLLICGAPKTETSIRHIPFPCFLEPLFRDKKKKEKADEMDFIFPGKKNAYKDPRAVQRRLASICRELELKDVHMHTLRHTFAARCLEKQVGYEVLSEFLGHSSPRITLDRYAHCTPDTKRESIERLERLAKAIVRS